MAVAIIGNGLFVKSGQGLSLLEQYRINQTLCAHTQRDPHGTCYKCGHRQPK